MSVFTNPASASSEHAGAYTRAVLGLLGDDDPFTVLRSTPAALRSIVAGRSDAELSAPEEPGRWSVRHVVRHLADSEIVWGWRLRLILAQDRPPLTGYDQDAWADRLDYAHADVGESLDELEVLRRSHLRLLHRLPGPALERVGIHAERGEESVRHLLRLYAGHDRLHLRQAERILQATGARPAAGRGEAPGS